MPYPERLETQRLILRRWEPTDAPALATIWAEPEVWGTMRPGEAFDPERWRDSYQRWIYHWDEYGFGLWAAAERGGEGVAGWVGAQHPLFIPELAEDVEIAWTLRRRFWGRGLATEGAAAAIDAAFAHLGVDELISLIHPANQRSIAVAARVGMRPSRDAWHPEIDERLQVYALPRSAWRPNSRRGASPHSTSRR